MNKTAADRVSLIALVALLLVAFAFGGGGSRYGLANLAVQLTALTVLAIRGDSARRFWRESPLLLRLLIAATLLVPLAQVIPLPEQVWKALPGHDLVARAYEAAGVGGWMTWSVNPLRTMLALTALVTPLAVVMAGWSLPRRELMLAGWLVVALGIVTTLMGVVQLNPAGDNVLLYAARDPGSFLVGTFANRNSTAILLGFCLALACLLPAPRPHPAALWVRVAVASLLVVAIVLTKSRTGLALAVIPLGLAGLKAWAWMLERRRATADKRRGLNPILMALGAVALGATALGGLVIAAPGRVGETLERFEAKNDPRRYIWEDAAYAVDRYWPAGSGMGTFDEVFQIDESLENLTLRTAGRAHNDYIELAIEAGLAGMTMAALWFVACLVMAWQARRSQIAWAGWAGGAFLLAIALQSITDYPLRNQAILAFAGFALLLLARAACERERDAR
ncbi:O-antigen ligase family protein [Porphyrobacter sp. ULC335]|uniref:O-antigen ligase family protein n=1 Tax=Porphyrobacter sp. ULC335 TaxID=2854260 RepID=UPI00221E3A2B|nr:O-antigen ligase family protein [Porphyrobacter sp. ULC335]UYV15880.1 O-antigen ligase family protein [Porphyrobacter sp. ULC335]